MFEVDKTLNPSEYALLRLLKGKLVDSIDACMVGEGTALNAVRFHFRNLAVDICNHHRHIAVDEYGHTQKFGLMHMSAGERDVLVLPEQDIQATSTPIGKEVCGVQIIHQLISIYESDELATSIKCLQGVVVDFGDEVILLDREAWFNETITIKRGSNAMEMLYDDGENWTDEPEGKTPIRFEQSVEIVEV